MNQAVALLAVSQLVCLVAVAYLYIQVHLLRRGGGRRAAQRPAPAARSTVEQDLTPVAVPTATTGRMAQNAYAPLQSQRRSEPTKPVPSPVATGQVTFDSAAIAARMAELGVDVPMLARRMRKSEAEVRALLGRPVAGR